MVSFVAVMHKPLINMWFSRCTDKNPRKYFVSEIRSLLPCEVFFSSCLSNFKRIWNSFTSVVISAILRCLCFFASGANYQPSLRQFS